MKLSKAQKRLYESIKRRQNVAASITDMDAMIRNYGGDRDFWSDMANGIMIVSADGRTIHALKKAGLIETDGSYSIRRRHAVALVKLVK